MNNINGQTQELAEFCRRLYNRKYIAGTEGNLSLRLPDDKILITPGGFNKGFINPEDMVTCNSDGEKLEGIHQPSSEVKIHVTVYKNRKDVNALCHAHPVFATAISLAGKPLNEAILPEFVTALGVVPVVRYATPGSQELALNLLEVLEKYDAFLLEKHGSLTLGRTMMEAFNRTEILERYSKLLFYTGQVESPKLIPREEADRLLDIGGRSNLKGVIIAGENNL
ncbi:MAG: class II aldolase/adducin family protein [Candidatus Zixiibacteriota bacterium]|nr:MAG: class II aldolase/adducin family protein [candidate division Zixibacteria bacterium]